MKHFILAAIMGVAISTTGAVSAKAGSFAEDFFKQLQRNGNVISDTFYEDKRLNGN